MFFFIFRTSAQSASVRGVNRKHVWKRKMLHTYTHVFFTSPVHIYFPHRSCIYIFFTSVGNLNLHTYLWPLERGASLNKNESTIYNKWYDWWHKWYKTGHRLNATCSCLPCSCLRPLKFWKFLLHVQFFSSSSCWKNWCLLPCAIHHRNCLMMNVHHHPPRETGHRLNATCSCFPCSCLRPTFWS